jgi:hypothetical protein
MLGATKSRFAKKKNMLKSIVSILALGTVGMAAPATTAGKPVQVYIMMGQSNMLGEGRKSGTGRENAGSLSNAVQNEGKYPYLWDNATGNWSVSKNVRSVFLMASGGPTSAITLFNNEFMTAAETTPGPVPGLTSKNKNSIGQVPKQIPPPLLKWKWIGLRGKERRGE